jgi:hypothetical protein
MEKGGRAGAYAPTHGFAVTYIYDRMFNMAGFEI